LGPFPLQAISSLIPPFPYSPGRAQSVVDGPFQKYCTPFFSVFRCRSIAPVYFRVPFVFGLGSRSTIQIQCLTSDNPIKSRPSASPFLVTFPSRGVAHLVWRFPGNSPDAVRACQRFFSRERATALDPPVLADFPLPPKVFRPQAGPLFVSTSLECFFFRDPF